MRPEKKPLHLDVLKQKNRRGITPYGSLNTQTAEKHNGKEIKAESVEMSTFFFQQRHKLIQCCHAADNLHYFVGIYTLAKVCKESLALVLDELDDCFELVPVR